MMAIYKYKNKKNQIRYRAYVYINGKLIDSKRGFLKIRDAEIWHDERHIDLLKDYSLIELQEKRFEELAEQFKSIYLPKLKSQTQDRYLYDLERIEPRFNNYKLSQIRPQIIEDFQSGLIKTKVYSGRGTINSSQKIEEMKQKGLELPYRLMAPKSINLCIGVLSTMFNFAIDLGWITKNPAKRIKKLAVENKGFVWWKNKEDIEKFLDEVKRSTTYYTFYLTTLQLGLRLGEISALKKSDFDYGHRTLSINEQWNCRHRKTESLKGNKPRIVAVSDELAEELRKRWKKVYIQHLFFVHQQGVESMLKH